MCEASVPAGSEGLLLAAVCGALGDADEELCSRLLQEDCPKGFFQPLLELQSANSSWSGRQLEDPCEALASLCLEPRAFLCSLQAFT